MNTLGKRLKQARKARNMTQKELESRSGVSQQFISKIEQEKIENTTEVFNLSEALKISAKWLATGSGNMTEDVMTARAMDGLTNEAMEFAYAFQQLPPEQRAVLETTAKAFMDAAKKPKGKVA